MEEALLLLRLSLAALMFGHAAQKLFGWFRGNGITKHGEIFESMGLKPGRVMVAFAGLTELAGLTLVASGFLTTLGATMLLATMIVAAAALFHNGVWAHLGGYEVALTYGLIAIVIMISGPGAYSIDALIGLEFSGITWALAGMAVAFIGSLPLTVQLFRHRAKA
jgi:putative oxidoreductase